VAKINAYFEDNKVAATTRFTENAIEFTVGSIFLGDGFLLSQD